MKYFLEFVSELFEYLFITLLPQWHHIWGPVLQRKNKRVSNPRKTLLRLLFETNALIKWDHVVLFSFNGISKKGFFLLYYVFFAVQSEIFCGRT